MKRREFDDVPDIYRVVLRENVLDAEIPVDGIAGLDSRRLRQIGRMKWRRAAWAGVRAAAVALIENASSRQIAGVLGDGGIHRGSCLRGRALVPDVIEDLIVGHAEAGADRGGAGVARGIRQNRCAARSSSTSAAGAPAKVSTPGTSAMLLSANSFMDFGIAGEFVTNAKVQAQVAWWPSSCRWRSHIGRCCCRNTACRPRYARREKFGTLSWRKRSRAPYS